MSDTKSDTVYFDLIDGTFGSGGDDDGVGMTNLGLDRPALRRVLKWLHDDLKFSDDTPVEFTPQDDGNVLVEVGSEGITQKYLVTSEGLPVRQS